MGKLNPKLQYCRCGYTFTPTLIMKLRMLIKGSYIYHCPVCHRSLKLILVNHVVCVDSKENLDEKIWRNS